MSTTSTTTRRVITIDIEQLIDNNFFGENPDAVTIYFRWQRCMEELATADDQPIRWPCLTQSRLVRVDGVEDHKDSPEGIWWETQSKRALAITIALSGSDFYWSQFGGWKWDSEPDTWGEGFSTLEALYQALGYPM